MFRIRRIFDDGTPANQAVIEQAQDILRAQFSMMPEAEIRKLPGRLRDLLKFRYRSILSVAQGAADRVRGVAVLLHLSDLGACYLESLSNAPGVSGRGIGAALCQRVREEARALDCVGPFFEALPDDPALSRDEAIRRQNAERLKVYERVGARPDRLVAAFYRNRGYRKLADLPDFYRKGEGKAIYAMDIVHEEVVSAAKESANGPPDRASA